MYFYQAYVIGSKHVYPLRDTREAAQRDLAATYEICGLREDEKYGILFDPNRNIGVAIIRV